MLSKIKTLIAVAVLSGTVSANVQAATITVQKGDTLWDLANANNTSLENIQKLNHLTSDLIQPGDVLTIAPEKHYIVEQGDTLPSIAKDHKVTVSQIKEWNNLISDLIHPGLNLLIFDDVNSNNNAVTEKQTESAATEQTEAAPQPDPKAQPEQKAQPKQDAQPKEKTQPEQKAQPKVEQASQQVITVKATAYTASCAGCSGITKTGVNIKDNPNAKVIAVDPSVIPLGSKVYVEGFGEATAADTGGAIKGKHIDIFIPSEQDAVNFGVKHLKVTILKKG